MAYKRKKTIERHPESYELNTNLIFQKWALGTVVIYSEEKFTKHLSVKEKQSTIRKITSLVQADINRLIEKDRNKYLRLLTTPARVIDNIFDSSSVTELLNEYVFDKGMLISEAYQLAFKVEFKKQEKDFDPRYSKNIKAAIRKHQEVIQNRILSNTHHVLLEQASKKTKGNFILVVDHLTPEIFFRPSTRLQGIIYRNKHHKELFNHLAIYYQYPIVHHEDELQDGELILINVATQSVHKNPTRDLLNTYRKSIKYQLIGGYGVDSVSFENYSLRTMISNYKDAKLANLHPLFNRSLLYYTGPVMIAKGAPLSFDEWFERFSYIFQTYKGKEIMIRIPSFNQVMMIDEVDSKFQIKNLLDDYPEIYEPLFRAASKALDLYPKERLYFVVPELESKMDFDIFEYHIKYMMENNQYAERVETVFEFGTYRAMFEAEELRKQDYFIANLDLLACSYLPEYAWSRNTLNYDKLHDSNLHADIQHLKLTARETWNYHGEVSISGYHLTEESIFRRYVNIQHKCFIVPVQSNGYLIDIIQQKIARKGKYVGVYERDRDRTLFYRNIAENSKNDKKYEKPRGLYGKVKNLKNKKKDNDDTEEK